MNLLSTDKNSESVEDSIATRCGDEYELLTMLKIVKSLRDLELDFDVYCVASHERLFLTKELDTAWLVGIQPDGFTGYRISYVLPEDEQPWKGAWVTGRFKSPEEATEAVKIGMKLSGGWDF